MPRPEPEPEPADPLAALRAGLRSTHEAAQRLAAEGGVPPQGWAAPAGERDGAGNEIAALGAMLQALVDLVPPELQHQLAEVIRQVLALLRALIDFWITRLESERGAEPVVQDIPIA